MHRIIISNLGPIEKCDIEINDFLVLTGPQASGKSTIAKAIYYFRSIKEDVFQLILETVNRQEKMISNDMFPNLRAKLREKFLQMFGTSYSMSNMELHYYYDKRKYIKITLEEGSKYVLVTICGVLSKELASFFDNLNNNLVIESGKMFDNYYRSTLKNIENLLNKIFNDEFESVFIPAGRSLISLLSDQLGLLFTTMDDKQRRNIDYCTQSYINKILRIKNSFTQSMENMIDEKKNLTTEIINLSLLNQISKVAKSVLKGDYKYVKGEERIVLENQKFIKINYTSSGQQESLWIFNLLFYYVLENEKVFLILEEPEAHLYPNSQKNIAEAIGLFFQNGLNNVLITTHSPYILGALNNLMYAYQLKQKGVSIPISENMCISDKLTSAYYVINRFLSNCIDEETHLIKNEVIDGASIEINEQYDIMFNNSIESDKE